MHLKGVSFKYWPGYTSTETFFLIRDWEIFWEGGMEVGGEGDYIPIA